MITPPRHLPAAGPQLLIALDVDGTILHHSGKLSDAVATALRSHLDAGTHVVLATGRGPWAVKPVLEVCGITNSLVVSSNGAITLHVEDDYEDLEILNAVTFDAAHALLTVRELIPEALIMVEDSQGVRRVTGKFPNGEMIGNPEVVPFEELLGIPATCVTIRAPEMDPAQMENVFAAAKLHGVTYAIGWTSWVDLAPEGISKASALERVREHYGVSPFATVAVGDGNNDIEMLDWASWSVAMGQASESTRSHANAVAPSVEDNGLAVVLNALLP